MKGLFEKRLKKGLPDYFRETDNDNFITRMIDEARKEFEAVVGRSAEEHGYKTAILIKKWFGDGK